MQVGDPKKTAFLAVVAVAAIGFCFKQLFGGDSGPKVLRQATTTTDPAAGTPGATLAMVSLDNLRTDPFSHPKLGPKGTPAGPPPGSGSKPGPVEPGGDPESGSKLPDATNPFPIDRKFGPDWRNPQGPGEKPTNVSVTRVPTKVTLKAIVKVNQRMAYISIDGQEARAFRPGDIIKDDIQVAFVNDDSVIVKSTTATVTLRVGQQGDL